MVVAINQPRPQQQFREPRSREENGLDKLLKALNIANAGMGIAVNYNAIGKHQADTAKTKQLTEESRLRTEALPTKEEADASRLADTEKSQRAEGRQDVGMALEAGKLAETQRSNTAREEIQRLQVNQKKIDQSVKARQLNQSQAKSQGFGNRMEQAELVFDKLDADGYDRSDILSAAATYFLPNRIRSKESQMQEQAEINFVNALARDESGATIKDEEFEKAEKQYFPRSGDKPEVIAQKKRNREIKLDQFKGELGEKWVSIKEIKKQEQTQNQNKVIIDQLKAFDPSLSDAEVIRSARILKQGMGGQ